MWNGFQAGCSPGRINPGDKVHTLTNIIKIVSGCDSEALDTIAKVYGGHFFKSLQLQVLLVDVKEL